METVILKRSHRVALVLLYILLSVVGWRIGGYLGVIAGVGLTYLVDRFYPRWHIGVDRNDLRRGICNFHEYGIVGSRMFFQIGRRELIVFRIRMGSETELGIQFFPGDWNDCLSPQRMKDLFGEWAGVSFESDWKGKTHSYMTVSVTKDIDTSLVTLVDIFLKAAGVRIEDVPIRIDYAKRNIWGEYGRDDGASRADA